MTRILLSSVAAAAVLASAQGAVAQTEIQCWHAMGGNLGEAVNALAEGFNKSQTEYKVTPVYKGSYTETLTAAIAAFRAKQAPHIVQVFEVGTANMMAAKGAVYPVYQLMADAKEPFDPKAYIGPVYGYYSTTDGKLLSMPFNSSTPVLYWNKELLQKAGLDPEQAAEDLAGAGRDGQEGRRRRRQVRVHAAVADLDDDRELRRLAQPAVRHQGQRLRRHRHRAEVQRRAARQAHRRRSPTGARTRRSSTAAVRASRRRCSTPATAPSTSPRRPRRRRSTRRWAQDKFGIAMMPYSPDVIAKPQNSIIGGATLWVLQGKPARRVQGRRQVPELPVEHPGAGQVAPGDGLRAGHARRRRDHRQGRLLQDQPRAATIAVKELTLNPPTANSKGLRIGNFVQIRDIVDSELENVWSGKKDAKTALDDAVKAGNEQLKRFEAANK